MNHGNGLQPHPNNNFPTVGQHIVVKHLRSEPGEVFEGQEFRDDNCRLQVSIFGSPSSGEHASCTQLLTK